MWYVVIDRYEHAERGELGPELPPYAAGPYATEAEGLEELDSDAGVVYDLLTGTAKSENYIATEAQLVYSLPESAVVVGS